MARIHPFDDGNGRGARILMNLILLKQGRFPAVLRVERRRDYIEALQRADGGDLTPFLEFVALESLHTLEGAIDDMLKLDNDASNRQGGLS